MSHQCRHEICKKSNPRFAKASSRDRHEQSEKMHQECWVSLGMMQRCQACTLWESSGKMRKTKKPKGTFLCGHALCNERYAHKSSRDFHQRQESHPLCWPQNICAICQAKYTVIEEDNRTKMKSDNEGVEQLALQLMEEINIDSTQTEQTESFRSESYSLTGLPFPTSTMETEVFLPFPQQSGGAPFATYEQPVVPESFCEQIRSEIISDVVTTSEQRPNPFDPVGLGKSNSKFKVCIHLCWLLANNSGTTKRRWWRYGFGYGCW